MATEKSHKAVLTGVDLVSIERIRAASGRERFLARVFTEKELEYSFGKRLPYRHLAGRFAAKEAFIKALSSIGPSIALKDVEVVNSDSGAPCLKTSPKARALLGGRQAFLSISYSNGLALAFVAIQ
ncbi:MAG: holo-ACP synthase [Deltaproteobacteria bacterium]|nr:holo-ACP synthase [Deltaproteobacteria bacterium]